MESCRKQPIKVISNDNYETRRENQVLLKTCPSKSSTIFRDCGMVSWYQSSHRRCSRQTSYNRSRPRNNIQWAWNTRAAGMSSIGVIFGWRASIVQATHPALPTNPKQQTQDLLRGRDVLGVISNIWLHVDSGNNSHHENVGRTTSSRTSAYLQDKIERLQDDNARAKITNVGKKALGLLRDESMLNSAPVEKLRIRSPSMFCILDANIRFKADLWHFQKASQHHLKAFVRAPSTDIFRFPRPYCSRLGEAS